jgi:ectoine hydroxylase-related dioxygenase (phytanoyl-CoA dioxygenase family)
LLVVDKSHEFTDLVQASQNVDYESIETPLVQVLQDPSELARSRGVKLKTANFNAGDIILFSMTLLHGSLDNRSEQGRVRLSSDVRWQPAKDPVDPRYMGDNPAGTTGVGYGELNGAKPLTIDWHQR